MAHARRCPTTQADALLRTLLVEMPIGIACLWLATRTNAWGRRDDEPPPAAWRVCVMAFAVSLVTHPFAWWSNRGLAPLLPFATRAALVESAVVIVEAVLLRGALRLRWRAAIVTSLAMNVASFGYGVWLMLRAH
ncbi:MAG: hypothetical protein IPH07_09960 [Deltaproteobacteria bacterium]|nr:hypothetical protein [Deltaproteobacteria bacterium]MBK8718758.1 hypothetical protein [Deltaproteobacteria bacterium]MBP7286470.1 hypothetical protein [Nannocystaceae bacterium]